MKLLVSHCHVSHLSRQLPQLSQATMSRTVCRDGSLRASEVSLPLPCAKRNQGSDGFESFEHWFTASLMIFQASGLVAMGFRQKVWQPDFGQSCVTVCVLRHPFFQCFHGWSTDPFRKHRHLQAIWVGIGRFLCGRDASKGDAPWNLRPRFAAPRSWKLIGSRKAS